jgi:pimeloyl-ACP methyl ester carboxylesterase
VLVIRGALEAESSSIASLLPQSTVVRIPDCGHISNMEQPQAFNATLHRFLGSLA